MRGNVKTIKLTTWLSLVLGIITYAISVKGMFGVCECKLFPDTFLLTIFGGAFASMLVVLICEISKYIQNRESTESYLFSHLYYLYGQLQVMRKNISFLIDHTDQIYKNALSQLIANVEAEMNTVYYADYAPFRKDNLILISKMNYNNKVFPTVQKFLQNCSMLEIAVLTDAINAKENGQKIDESTGSNAFAVLIKLSEQIQEPLSLIDEFLTKIDQSTQGRYNWQRVKEDMVKGIPDNRTDMLEQFIGK